MEPFLVRHNKEVLLKTLLIVISVQQFQWVFWQRNRSSRVDLGNLLREVIKLNFHLDIFQVTGKLLDMDNLINSCLEVEFGNDFPELARLELGHPKNILDMEQ